ncbi:Asp23/Gls24 family envelope stress response protein [Frigoribacterium sp. VKM Ac-2836]|uniref:Asp23/Gls24 family envelope stress response protein n=1 Tax=Frigoribacterium sp. VKM Ac-2836 TaxID=2739014 RepID=UPI0015643458|nr:Asp23/Gls24 family envelope stress response protein [Frigoribacterium sp. VKM Ac-2836]NRD26254.1 Asp23/Gls24 family envelope stress response protein [Frigoribacterium sp. VKM Ac-2836]
MAPADTAPRSTLSSTPAPITTAPAGRTVVADGVVAKVAGIAAREVPGVFALGGGTARAFGALRDVIGTTDLGQGVRVEVGETQVAADVTIVVEYPTPMHTVAEQVRAAVTRTIEQLVGMEVAEVNVAINDVHIPGDDDADDDAMRQSRVS